MRILCLPLDSRPCNTQWVRELVAWAGSEAVLPQEEEMDRFFTPAPHAASRAFLERELPGCGAAVISLDHWCYGGLLASRAEDVSPEEALSRVEELKEILARHPQTPVFMSSVITRSSISTLSQDDLDVYRAMTDYSFYTGRYAQEGREEDARLAEAARKRIPEAVLGKVMRVRARNLRVNLAAVDLAAEGRVRALSLLQEDTQVYGLPRKDQAEIARRLAKTGAKNVFLRNGADEGGTLSAAEALSMGRESLPAELCFLGDSGFTALYEDRPFAKNVENACLEIGIRPQAGSENVLFVCCPPDGKQKEAGQEREDPAIAAYGAAIEKKVREGRRVYVLDVIGANGGSLALLRGLSCPEKLWGYSAWNTASNSLGTLLAQMVSDSIRGSRNEAFYQARLLDDLLYQTVIRFQLADQLKAWGEDPLRIRDRKRAEEALSRLYREALPARWPLKTTPHFRATLPWNRSFEVKISEVQTGKE